MRKTTTKKSNASRVQPRMPAATANLHPGAPASETTAAASISSKCIKWSLFQQRYAAGELSREHINFRLHRTSGLTLAENTIVSRLLLRLDMFTATRSLFSSTLRQRGACSSFQNPKPNALFDRLTTCPRTDFCFIDETLIFFSPLFLYRRDYRGNLGVRSFLA